jgi:hypothetical protein
MRKVSVLRHQLGWHRPELPASVLVLLVVLRDDGRRARRPFEHRSSGSSRGPALEPAAPADNPSTPERVPGRVPSGLPVGGRLQP